MIKRKKYNIGLDIGTTSVGWAVVETDTQEIMRKGNKSLWGVRLFEEASTAEFRRTARSTRRRYDRRKERIKLLQQQFKNEMDRVDKRFFQKLQESKYVEKDTVNKKVILTKEEQKEIKNYQNKYKTIYHLRNELINNYEKKDIRLVYLALHHIIKYRGNFLYENSNFNIDNLNIKEKLAALFTLLSTNISDFKIDEEYEDLNLFDKLEKDLLEQSKRDVSTLLKKDLEDIVNKNFIMEFIKLMVGNKCNLNKLLSLEFDNKVEINFNVDDYEEKYNEYQSILGTKIEILDILKQIYDNVFLKKIFKDQKNISISSLMVKHYNQHKKDLNLIKKVFRENRKIYNKIFRTNNNVCFYDKYITNKMTVEEFKREISKLLSELINYENHEQETSDENIFALNNRLDNEDFLPRITTTDNGKYPYQLNKIELIKIIENQGKYYPFLLEKLKDNKTYKIERLLEFKIPYYVGPLVSSKRSNNAWLERKTDNIKITPYNFDEVVDKEKTAEEFIRRMMSHCTYLFNEYALPNNSILYSKFKVMNELKQIRINGRKIELNFQKVLLEDFFKKTSGSITEKKFKNYLLSTNEYVMEQNDLKITGYSDENKFANNMQSYIDFFGKDGIFENTSYNENDAEQIIEWITIFEDKDILLKKVKEQYKNLNEYQLQKILIKKYKGWGNLSKKVLTTKYYKDKKTELYKSILDLMLETEGNFMQIINNDEYNFQKMIQKFNHMENNDKLDYSVVEELTTSPSTKKGIYQSLKVVDEIVNYIGYEPDNIAIEMARGDEKKVRKVNKKDYLKKLYVGCKDSIDNYKRLKHELDSSEITSQKLFLYFIQEGKCLYSGEPLNIEDIENQSLYEVDHIIPRTLIKDDSLENKALVLRKYNQDKKANYVLPRQYRNEYQKVWWKHLKDSGLISSKKFHNLIRDKYSDDDIKGFINRQLVETRQITKHVANILKNYYKDSNIIYLKADLLHNYREKYNLFKFRDINDYHHAHDAYLVAVLGEYKEKYIRGEIDFNMIIELNNQIINNKQIDNSCLKYGYVINSLDENLSNIILKNSTRFSDKNTGEVFFDAHEFNRKVEETLYRNDIFVSRKTEVRSGQFYKETIYKKGKGTVPIKSNMPVEIYGGYSNTNTKKLMLIEYNQNQKKVIGIPMLLAVKNHQEEINEFIKSQISLKKDASFNILKNSIPFETELLYKNQKVFIKGYSIECKNCEVSNATQLKIFKNQMIKWKYALHYLLNDKEKYLEEANNYVNEIYEYLINLDIYPLFKREMDKIKNKIDFNNLDIFQKKKIIKELFKMFHCNSTNANLSEFNLGDRIGRLSGNNITSGVIISKSITGIRESKYEF